MGTAPFAGWYSIYGESVGELSKSTWLKGIVLEVQKIGITGGSVLDLGGGNGVGSELLQSLGAFRVTALDLSQSMLDLNHTATTKIRGDFLEIENLTGSFDLIVSGFDSFNYLRPKDLPRFFRGVAKVLNPNGRLIFDYSSPKFLSKDWAEAKFSQDVADGRLDWKTKFDLSESRCDIELAYWKDGKQEWVEAHRQYTVNAYEMNETLDGSPLSIECVRNLDGETFSPQANTHVYVIRQAARE